MISIEERRSRRFTAADRAPQPLVGRESVHADIEAARGALNGAITLAEQPRTVRYTVTGAPGFLVKVVRNVLYLNDAPMTAYQIAHVVTRRYPNRWDPDTIRRKCGKAGLVIVGEGVSPSGSPCQLFALAPA